MPRDTICKIVRQHNKGPVSPEDMQKLLEVAKDYASVKNYVYQRYGGIRSLSKIYPVYTVQNEMARSGLRERLGMPSVYFFLAVFDAVWEIKAHWTQVKSLVLKQIHIHEGLTEEEKHFLRFLLKVNHAFEAALNGTPLNLPGGIQKQYDKLASSVDVEKLKNYLRRQVRKRNKKRHVDKVKGFSLTERAYRYGDHGIYISVKQKRKRIFIPLTDGNCYTRQLYIRLFPEQGGVEIRAPIDVAVKGHRDYTHAVGVSMGITAMLVTHEGHLYGEEYGNYQMRLSGWLREQTISYSQNFGENLGRKKYQAKKRRLEDQLHCYINQELNRFFREEKPKVVYLPRLPQTGAVRLSKEANYLLSTWQRGYIKNRLMQKCREQSVEFVEVPGKGISNTCSRCGFAGGNQGDQFICPRCGYEGMRRVNAAQNAKKRGEGPASVSR